MRYGGILVILLFLLTGCAAAPMASDAWLAEGDRVFSETDDPKLILTYETPQQVLEALQNQYSSVQVDFQSEHALYATIHTNPTQRIVVVENDLDGEEPYLIMITIH